METGLLGVVLLVLPWWIVFSILIRAWTAGSNEDAGAAGCLITILLTVLVSSQMDSTLANKSGMLIYYFLGTTFTLRESSIMDDGPEITI